MKYKSIQVKLKTIKSKNYLWNKINTPEKIIKIEEFKNPKVKKISENNYELISKYYHVILTFIPKKSVNMIFVNKKNFPLAWFEITDTHLIHGEYKRITKSLKDDTIFIKKHFLEELKKIVD